MKKVLYIEPNNNSSYLYYTYIGKALSQRSDISATIGSNLFSYNLNDYDLVLLGFGACAQQFPDIELKTSTPILGFLFKLSIHQESKINFFKKNNVILFGQNSRIPEFEEKFDIEIIPNLYPIDTSLFKCLNLDKSFDVSMTGALHDSSLYAKTAYLPSQLNIRQRIVEKLSTIDCKKFVNCSDINNKAYINDINDYIKKINESKIWICTNADHGDITARVSEVLSCKTLAFINEHPPNTLNDILINEKTCVFFKNDLSDLEEKIKFYINNNKERELIAEAGHNTYTSRFNSNKFVDRVIQYAK